jgi:hypothetical protein
MPDAGYWLVRAMMIRHSSIAKLPARSIGAPCIYRVAVAMNRHRRESSYVQLR